MAPPLPPVQTVESALGVPAGSLQVPSSCVITAKFELETSIMRTSVLVRQFDLLISFLLHIIPTKHVPLSLQEAASAIAASVGAGVGGLSPLRCLTLYLERLSPRCADPACLPLVRARTP